jgi:hypothetical protein
MERRFYKNRKKRKRIQYKWKEIGKGIQGESAIAGITKESNDYKKGYIEGIEPWKMSIISCLKKGNVSL